MNATLPRALASGLAGALALNESARRLLPHAPRLELLGERALVRAYRLAGAAPPREPALYWQALAGDVAANTLYYALVEPGARPRRWLRGALLGLGAGVGSVALPPAMGLGYAPTRRTRTTEALTVLWYLAGGLAAAAAADRLAR